jgi:hypothetical protein
MPTVGDKEVNENQTKAMAGIRMEYGQEIVRVSKLLDDQ